MMAETFSQNADGSNNPTGEALPQDGPQVHSGVPTAKTSAKRVSAGQAETKVVEPGDAENKSAAKKTAKKKG